MNQVNQFGLKDGRFESYYGISLNYAEKGQKVKVAFRLNCQDKRSEDDQTRLVADILDNHAYPEVMGCIANGSLTSDFRLHSVHLVMFRDINRNKILLNEDVKFMPNVKYKNSKVFKEGENVNFEDIDDILGLYPDTTNDPNSGHIMLTKFKDRWYYACDLIYELELSKKLSERATTFIDTANENMKNKYWKLFLNNLLCICMLLTQAIFILQYNKYFSLRQTHKINIERLAEWANNGNINPTYSELYNKVFELRRNIKRDDIIKKEANGLLLIASKFIEDVKNMVGSLTYSRTPPLNYIKLIPRIQKKEIEKFKLISFGGIAAEYAADFDETVKLRFQINCKDKFLENTKSLMIFDILDNYAYPEVMRHVEKGMSPDNFRLYNVHLLMYADQNRNKILLNDDVLTVAQTKFKENKKFQKGDPIRQMDVEDYLGLYPSENVDKNASNVILTKLSGLWYCAYDLIYDRKRVGSRYELARQFLKVANYCLQEKMWGAYVDTLHSATELAIQSILLLHHHPKFSIYQTHPDTFELFCEHAKLGNIDIKFSDHYDNLRKLRSKGRYLNNLQDKEFALSNIEAGELINITKNLMNYIQKLMETVDLAKKPPVGEYCLLGKLAR